VVASLCTHTHTHNDNDVPSRDGAACGTTGWRVDAEKGSARRASRRVRATASCTFVVE